MSDPPVDYPGKQDAEAFSPEQVPGRFRVIALLAAYNEADIIGTAVQYLIDQGIEVYFLDNGSTDSTVAEVERFVGRGVIHIEQFGTMPDAGGNASTFQWEALLRRKEELARELPANWFIHHDADEFRESPWRDRTLAAAIETVDMAGYNAIDFAVLNFWPTHDDFSPGDDVRHSFRYCEPGEQYDRIQIKCWKKTDAAIDLASVGGHDVSFTGRRVFPIRFLLRHYPIRSQQHGARKVFHERRPRFDPVERAKGWHVQYDDITAKHNFIRDPASMTLYDPDAIRLNLIMEHRGVEALREKLDAIICDTAKLADEKHALQQALSALGAEVIEFAAQRAEAERLRIEVSHLQAAHLLAVDALDGELTAVRGEMAGLRDEMAELQDRHARSIADAERFRGQLKSARLAADEMVQQHHFSLTAAEMARDRTQVLLGTVQQQLEAARNEITGLRASRSWRLTSPLRRVHDELRRLQGLPPA